MAVSVTPALLGRHPTRRAVGTLALAAAAWLVAYNLIQPLADWLTYGLLGLAHGSQMGKSVAFFLYDVPKILLLLSGMIFAISIIARSSVPSAHGRSLAASAKASAMCLRRASAW